MHGPGLYPGRESGDYKDCNGQLAKMNVDYGLGNSIVAMLNIVTSSMNCGYEDSDLVFRK